MMNKFAPGKGFSWINKEHKSEIVAEPEKGKLLATAAIKYEAQHPLEVLVDSVGEMLRVSKESGEAVTTNWREYQIIVYPDNTVEGVIGQYVDNYIADNLDIVLASKMTREDVMKMFMKSDNTSKQAIVNKENKVD